MSENREEFQRDLERIEAKVIELFAMVAEDLPRATDALLSGDNDRSRSTCATCYPYCVSSLSLSARTTWSSRSGAGPITASARS
jgi:hypothetical protein